MSYSPSIFIFTVQSQFYLLSSEVLMASMLESSILFPLVSFIITCCVIKCFLVNLQFPLKFTVCFWNFSRSGGQNFAQGPRDGFISVYQLVFKATTAHSIVNPLFVSSDKLVSASGCVRTTYTHTHTYSTVQSSLCIPAIVWQGGTHALGALYCL